MRELELVLESLALAGERGADITAAAYAHYFARCPESRQLMVLVDSHMRGRMLERVLQLLMSDQLEDERGYLEFETRTHVSYGVERHMYGNLLWGVRDAVQFAAGDAWTATHAAAWTVRLAAIDAEIRKAFELTAALA